MGARIAPPFMEATDTSRLVCVVVVSYQEYSLTLTLAPYLVSFPCFLLVFLEHPLVSWGNSVEIINFPGSEPSLRLVWAPNQPNRQNTGVFWVYLENPRVYLENTRVV